MESPASEGTKGLSRDDVERLWAAYRKGDVVRCPKDDRNLALSIDGSGKSYRLVCTHCGQASPWFSASQDGVTFRAIDACEVAERSPGRE
ncbi:MAG: hypothetical protein IPK71_23765 [Myxococcales bacterium]|jgi:hypothetical protein|nr:hypothetical protein [Myxococcales bacterium]MBL9109656.1 hypothetical protein [Myxococcales bacterium]